MCVAALGWNSSKVIDQPHGGRGFISLLIGRRRADMLWPLHIWLQMSGLMLAAPGGRLIDLSEAKQPEQPLHINPPHPQAYKYQHATGWDSDRTAADLRVSAPTSCLRLSLCPDASIQLCPACPAPPAAAGPDLQRRVAWQKREGKRACQKPDVRVRVWVKGEDGDFHLVFNENFWHKNI